MARGSGDSFCLEWRIRNGNGNGRGAAVRRECRPVGGRPFAVPWDRGEHGCQIKRERSSRRLPGIQRVWARSSCGGRRGGGVGGTDGWTYKWPIGPRGWICPVTGTCSSNHVCAVASASGSGRGR